MGWMAVSSFPPSHLPIFLPLEAGVPDCDPGPPTGLGVPPGRDLLFRKQGCDSQAAL